MSNAGVDSRARKRASRSRARPWLAVFVGLAVVAPMGATVPAAAVEPVPVDGIDGILVPVAAPEGLPTRPAPTTRERFVVPDVARLRRTVEAAAAGDGRVRLELFEDVVIDVPTVLFQPQAGGFSWGGRGTGPDGHEQSALLVHHRLTPDEVAAGRAETVVGHFWAGAPVRHFTLEAVAGAVHVVAELDERGLLDGDESGLNLPPAPQGPEPEAAVGGEAPALPEVPLPSTAMSHPGVHFVDVLVVYTRAAVGARMWSDPVEQLEAWIQIGNQANAASAIPFQFRAVQIAEVGHTEADSIATDLGRLTDGTIPNVLAWREQYSADLVTMVGSYDNYCGIANVGGAFSVVNANPTICENGLSMPHELGHNFGLHHDWAHDDSPGSAPYPWAHGFINPAGAFRTLMAYNDPDACPAHHCTRITRWSDPNATQDGFTTGVPRDQPNPADNAGALRDLYPIVEGFRTPPQRPTGAYDSLTQEGGGVRVAGWAVDFDTPATPIYVDLHVDGSHYDRYLASKPRPDLPNHYPNAGSAHGFNEILQLENGTHSVCVYAVDSDGSQAFSALGCKSITIWISPFGSLDGVSRAPGGARVSGWALDPETSVPITVRFDVDGTPVTTDAAEDSRPDVASAHPCCGPNHGFSTIVESPSGTHEFCVTAINVGAGHDVRIGCWTFTLAADPFGVINGVGRAPGGARVTGWAIDPDTDKPIPVRFLVDGVPAAADVAAKSRPDVGATFPDYGPDHGYSTLVPMVSGVTHDICVVGTNVHAGADATMGCTTFHPDPGTWGSVDFAGRDGDLVDFGGWALDWDTAAPVAVRATVDGVATVPTVAAENRPDIGAAHPEYGALHGYNLRVPVTPGPHRVCVVFVNVGPGADRDMGCWDFGGAASPYGYIDAAWRDSLGVVEVAGWAIDWDTTGSIPVRATVDGNPATVTVANEERNDVGAAYPAYGPNHGYTLRVPVAPGPHTVCVVAVNTGPGGDTTLGCPTL